jgi:hypothetical protein
MPEMDLHPDERHLIPFLVADRQSSLRIIRGIPLQDYDGPIGLMSHANTSSEFREAFRRYPCGPQLCPRAVGAEDCYSCRSCRALKSRTVKMCDSGVFTKSGCKLDYPNLFLRYENMGCEYGIMIDVLRNSRDTLESAAEAIQSYRELRPSFKLVGVAQGRTVKEYVKCYAKLKELGFAHVAIGGMLSKRLNTSHYAYVRSDQRLFPVLSTLRALYPSDWLFALGCYHPKRHLRMERIGVFGSDYKGWIFQYEKRSIREKHHARSSRYGQVRRFLSKDIFNGPLYLNGARADVFAAAKEGRTLGIVACGATKIWSSGKVNGPVPAQDAYIGPLFRAGKRYAEAFLDDWTILSGKHGFLPPTALLCSNYEARLKWTRDSAQAVELRKQILRQGLHKYSRVLVIGGNDYLEATRDAYAGTGILVEPVMVEPTRIGLMISQLNQAVSRGKAIAGGSSPSKDAGGPPFVKVDAQPLRVS